MELTVKADPDNGRVTVGPLVVLLKPSKGARKGIAAEWCGHKFLIDVDPRKKAHTK